MIAAVVFIVAACAAIAYGLVRQRPPTAGRQTGRGRAAVHARHGQAGDQPAPLRYGAVEIQVRNAACKAAGKLQGRRYLANEAPALPLAGCTAAQCTCAFVKLSDRRTEDRRIEHAALSSSLFLANNRRAQRGRREND